MPSNFKENTIDFSENISSHLEQIIDTGIRNFWKFPANTIFIRANAVFGYFFFEQILTANVKKSDSCYNVFIMVSVCLSCLLRLFLAHAPRRFGPASHQEVNSTLPKASSALGTFLWEKRTILWTFPRKLRSFILTLIDIKNF